MIPFGEPFDPDEHDLPGGVAEERAAPAASPVPARAVCRPMLTDRRGDPRQR